MSLRITILKDRLDYLIKDYKRIYIESKEVEADSNDDFSRGLKAGKRMEIANILDVLQSLKIEINK